jgi:8-amino-7-oxononanoate synthase
MLEMDKETTWLELEMKHTLMGRAAKGSLRVYQDGSCQIDDDDPSMNVDFSSNDYLGLARDAAQMKLVEDRYQAVVWNNNPKKEYSPCPTLGSTGSRLLSGDSRYARQLERRLAQWHSQPAALLFNSGYDANLSVLSCLPQIDRFLFDEYAHNSLRMGMRLSRRGNNHHHHHQHRMLRKLDEQNESFLHNNVDDLKRKLLQLEQEDKLAVTTRKKNILIVVESVYSMDGDVAPLRAILDLAQQFGALVLVDEAHGIGSFGDDLGNNTRGTGVLAQLNLEHHPALACSVHTFGKAAGCHGAVVCGSTTLRSYLWNYAWPLVYSTSLPLHSLVTIECSYETMTSPRGKALRQHTQKLVLLFRQLVQERIIGKQIPTQKHHQPHQTCQEVQLLPSTSPIQALVLTRNGNQACTEFCERVWQESHKTIRLYPIKSPTVPAGKERIRIILHGHNYKDQVHRLVECMEQSLIGMGILGPSLARL